MGVKVNILDNGRGIEMLLSGTVLGRDIIRAQEMVYNKKYLPCQRYQIIDKTRCTEYNVTYQDIESIANIDKQASKQNSKIVMAVIESETLKFSLTDLWQIHVDNAVFKTRAFISRDLAEQWILENI